MIWCFEDARLLDALKAEGDRLLASGMPVKDAERFVNGVRNFLKSEIARQHKLFFEPSGGAGAG